MSDQNIIYNNQRDERWQAFKRVASDWRFLQNMMQLKIEDIPEIKIAKVKNIIETSGTEGFSYDFLSRRNRTIAQLGKWVIHVVDFYERHKTIKPLLDHFQKISEKVNSIQSQISASEDRVKKANAYILEVQQKIEEAKIRQGELEQEVVHSKVQYEELEKLILGLSLIKIAESY